MRRCPGERFFGRRARSHRRCERKQMIDPAHELPVTRQPSCWRSPARTCTTCRELFRRLTSRLCAASTNCISTSRSQAVGCCVTCSSSKALPSARCRDADGEDGHRALYRPRNTSAPHPAHRVYPYPLGSLTIDQPNQVWAADSPYIPMQRGFVYLVAIMDWATRKVLSHCVSSACAPISASRRWKKRSPATASQKSSTPARAASSPLHAYASVTKARQQRASYFVFYHTRRPYSFFA